MGAGGSGEEIIQMTPLQDPAVTSSSDYQSGNSFPPPPPPIAPTSSVLNAVGVNPFHYNLESQNALSVKNRSPILIPPLPSPSDSIENLFSFKHPFGKVKNV